jgi:glycine/D-amino acid oxidase-like deaminating enzyme
MKVGKIEGLENAFTVVGCQGSGVTMCSLSGRRIADLAVGAIEQNALPAALSPPIQKFPFPGLRRAYLKAAYAYYTWQDS